MRNKTIFDILPTLRKRSRYVIDPIHTVLLAKDLVKEFTRLFVVAVRVHFTVSSDFARDSLVTPTVRFVFFRSTERVRLIVSGEHIPVSLHSHGPVSIVISAISRAVRTINRDLVVVWPESVPMSIRIVQKTPLKHLIHRWLNTWHEVRRRKSRLLRFSVVVSGVAVERDATDWD